MRKEDAAPPKAARYGAFEGYELTARLLLAQGAIEEDSEKDKIINDEVDSSTEIEGDDSSAGDGS